MKNKTVSQYWNDIFKKYNILKTIDKNGFYHISAKAIKEFKEPRLMTKFDHSKNRPRIFKENKLGILPIDNGMYVIGKFDLYKALPKNKDDKPNFMVLPEAFESIDPDNIYSESNALNVALLTGMISDIVGEDVYETISGRMRSSRFDFYLNAIEPYSKIEVNKPQIEIDGGYESSNKIVVVEAKNSEPEDFIIRQLYYPYRFWKMKVDKEIVPVLFTYKNGVYRFYIYRFEKEDNYNSITLIKELSYIIDYKNQHIINRDDLKIIAEDHNIPFPQADTFNRVKELISLIADGYNTSNKIANFFELTLRQGNYYLVAAKYLDLVEGKRHSNKLTSTGLSLLDMDLKTKNYELAKLILRHKPFLDVYNFYDKQGTFPDRQIIIKYMQEAKVNITDNKKVLNRRASTVKGWVQWIINSGIEVQ